jgi:hypothetical protein
MLLWQDHVDILVKSPKRGEVVDGRKLFLGSLLHTRLKKQLPDYVRNALQKLLLELNLENGSGMAIFNPQDRSMFDFAFIEQFERMNRILGQAA